MQPYFLPYWGYFSHIHLCDYWVVFDQPKYSRKTWMNRNYIRNGQGQPQLISVPVSFDNQQTKIIQNAIVQGKAMQPQWLCERLSHLRKSPFYDNVIQVVEQAYQSLDSHKLCELNVELISAICDYLGIEFNYIYSSQLNYNIDSVQNSGDWAFEICKAMGAKTYLNPITGLPIFDVDKFRNAGIEIEFFKTKGDGFKRDGIENPPYLSIMDTLFDHSVDAIMDTQKNSIDILSWEQGCDVLNHHNFY